MSQSTPTNLPWSKVFIRRMRNPWVVLLGAGVGAWIGAFSHPLADAIAPVGKVYLSLLGMCVLPILISAVTMSLCKLVGGPDGAKYARRITLAFLLGIAIAGLAGLLVGLVVGPGRTLSEATLQKLGVLVNQSGIDLQFPLAGPAPPPAPRVGLKQFLLGIFPDNIFRSLSEGNTLQVVFFSIVFGVTLALVESYSASTTAVFDTLDAVYKSFNKIVSALILLLPFGLCSLLATQVSKTGLDIVLAMVSFLMASAAAYALLYVVSTLFIWRRSRATLTHTINVLCEPSVLALASSNALACLPSAINAMSALRFSRRTVDLAIPLGVTLGRFGQVAFFALASLFVAQLYRVPLGPSELAVVLLSSALAGLASAGATGLVTLSALSVVLQPLGLPLEAVLALFIAVDPILDPLRTLCTLHTSMAATAAIAEIDTTVPEAVPAEVESKEGLFLA